MQRVALTGGIATGKSHVLGRFAALHVPTVDADRIARDVVRSGEPACEAIRARFGPDVFTSDGQLDRPRLASRVFADPAARTDLEAIVHPYVRRAIDLWFQEIARAGGAGFAVADIPLLFETNRAAEFDRVIVTACDQDTQLRRLMERDELSEEDARRRVAAQLPTAHKVARADFVVQTGGRVEETDRQVDSICRALGR
ncbi:MAG: dephospho-CoA kinase [Vicinamibacterales bacterium]